MHGVNASAATLLACHGWLAHFICPSLAEKPSSEAVPLTDTGGDGAAGPLFSHVSLLQDLRGGMPLAAELFSPPAQMQTGALSRQRSLALQHSGNRQPASTFITKAALGDMHQTCRAALRRSNWRQQKICRLLKHGTEE